MGWCVAEASQLANVPRRPILLPYLRGRESQSGFGSQSGHTEIYRGAEYAVNFVPKIKLEIVVSAGMAEQVVETIKTTAQTGKIGDGKIFVLDVQQAVRVRTGETDADAL